MRAGRFMRTRPQRINREFAQSSAYNLRRRAFTVPNSHHHGKSWPSGRREGEPRLSHLRRGPSPQPSVSTRRGRGLGAPDRDHARGPAPGHARRYPCRSVMKGRYTTAPTHRPMSHQQHQPLGQADKTSSHIAYSGLNPRRESRWQPRRKPPPSHQTRRVSWLDHHMLRSPRCRRQV